MSAVGKYADRCQPGLLLRWRMRLTAAPASSNGVSRNAIRLARGMRVRLFQVYGW